MTYLSFLYPDDDDQDLKKDDFAGDGSNDDDQEGDDGKEADLGDNEILEDEEEIE
jgi:hypothetical protein